MKPLNPLFNILRTKPDEHFKEYRLKQPRYRFPRLKTPTYHSEKYI